MNEQEQQIRIAIVDDHEMFRAGVIATLQPHFDIVGQASDVEGSVAMTFSKPPGTRSRMCWCSIITGSGQLRPVASRVPSTGKSAKLISYS